MSRERTDARRRYDAQRPFVIAFARRVLALTDDEWDRLHAHCASLNSSSFSALIDRARLGAAPWEMSAWRQPRLARPMRVLHGAVRVFQQTLSFGSSVAAEFESDADRRAESAHYHAVAERVAAKDEAMSLRFEVESVLALRSERTPGTVAAITAAMHALQGRTILLDDDAFAEIYKWVEPVIPVSSLGTLP
jgi:hypothetical protein